MAKKQYFLIVDVETTITDKVADFGAVICDRQGNIVKQCGIMVAGVFGIDSLFFDKNASGIWSQKSVDRRTEQYRNMVETGTRMMASVNAINRWLDQAQGAYNPELTAYNLPFDVSKCQNTGIDLTKFENRFCLWAASASMICKTKEYKKFIIENHLFNSPTEKGNMSFKTDAENVTRFLSGQNIPEPHTSLEDIIGYELPTLVHILKKKNWRDKIESYSWHGFQVKNHFEAKS